MGKGKIISVILILIGTAVLAVPCFFEIRNERNRSGDIEAFLNELEEQDALERGRMGNWSIYETGEDDGKHRRPDLSGTGEKKGGRNKDKGKDKKQEMNNGQQENERENLPLDGTYAIGIIEIPAIHLQYLVYEGTDEYELSKGIGHMEGTAALGQTGNCVLAGHTGSCDGVFFNRLPELEAGDEVVITTRDRVKITYQAASFFKTSPDDPAITKQPQKEDEKRLTLVTCADGGANRFVCQCILKVPEHAGKNGKGGDA